MADNHSDTIWAQGWMSVVRPMSRLGTLAFKVPIKVPALGTVFCLLVSDQQAVITGKPCMVSAFSNHINVRLLTSVTMAY